MLVVALVGMVLAVGGSYLESRVSAAVGRDMRRAVFSAFSRSQCRSLANWEPHH